MLVFSSDQFDLISQKAVEHAQERIRKWLYQTYPEKYFHLSKAKFVEEANTLIGLAKAQGFCLYSETIHYFDITFRFSRLNNGEIANQQAVEILSSQLEPAAKLDALESLVFP